MESLDNRNQDAVNAMSEGRTFAPTSDYNGTWEAVDASEMQIPLTAEPGKPFIGPDGEVYCIADSNPEFTGIQQNLNNAIPTPSSIIQMTPIVQPIALVPYASQNQPLLQYDPNSRPPEIIETKYKRKPYPVISGLACALSAIGIALILILFVISKASGKLSSVNGIEIISSFFASFGQNASGVYYDNFMKGVEGFTEKLVVYGIPIIEILMIVLFIVLIVKYFRRLVIAQSPRNFSIVAFVNVILSVVQMFLIFGAAKMLNEETTLGEFFSGKAQIGIGIGVWVTLVISLLILILPAFTNKKAYVVDNEQDNDTYYFED